MKMNDEDLQELIRDYLALPEDERPKAVEALEYLVLYQVINPPISQLMPK
jgi:hypothetical protein